MKRIQAITKAAPASAAAWQEAICIKVNFSNAILEATGGFSPIGQFVGEKCTLPTPEGD